MKNEQIQTINWENSWKSNQLINKPINYNETRYFSRTENHSKLKPPLFLFQFVHFTSCYFLFSWETTRKFSFSSHLSRFLLWQSLLCFRTCVRPVASSSHRISLEIFLMRVVSAVFKLDYTVIRETPRMMIRCVAQPLFKKLLRIFNISFFEPATTKKMGMRDDHVWELFDCSEEREWYDAYVRIL